MLKQNILVTKKTYFMISISYKSCHDPGIINYMMHAWVITPVYSVSSVVVFMQRQTVSSFTKTMPCFSVLLVTTRFYIYMELQQYDLWLKGQMFHSPD